MSSSNTRRTPQFKRDTTTAIVDDIGKPESSSEPILNNQYELPEISPATALPSPSISPLGHPKAKQSIWWVRNKGMVLVLISEMFGAFMAATARLLETGHKHDAGMNPFQILFARFGITTILSSLYMWYTNVPHFPLGIKGIRWLLVVRGAGGFFGVIGFYSSVKYLPLAEATVIIFLIPLLTAAACSFILHEPFSRKELIAGLISFFGVIVIAHPTSFLQSSVKVAAESIDENDPLNSTIISALNTTRVALVRPNYSSALYVTPAQRTMAVGFGLVGVLGGTCAYTAIRYIGHHAHPLISVNYYAILSFLISVGAMVFFPSVGFRLPANTREWGLLVFLGINGFLLQFLLTAGLQHDKSNRATNMMYAQVLFALALDKLIWGVVPEWSSIFGGSLVLGSIIFVTVQKTAVKVYSGEERRDDKEYGLIEGVEGNDGEEVEEQVDDEDIEREAQYS